MPLPPRYQIAKSLSVNASLITTPPFFIGDLTAVTISASTQSNAAIIVQVSNADGLQSPIPENSWTNVLTLSVQSTFLVPQIGARWSRTSGEASSNCTLIFAGFAPQ